MLYCVASIENCGDLGLTLHFNNVILAIPFVIWVARYRHQHGFIWWYCICNLWDQSS